MFYDSVNSELRIAFDEQMNMIRHDFHFNNLST